MKYVVELNTEQMHVVCEALDLYSRMGMGQLDVAVEEFVRTKFYQRYYEKPDPRATGKRRGEAVREAVNVIKSLVFGHAPNASWAIRSQRVPIRCREAFDILQQLRRPLAEDRVARIEAEGGDAGIARSSVHLADYFPVNPDQPPVKVERLSKTGDSQ